MFKIGDFSRISQVSVKALRYYDDVGLLKPSRVDPENGYRYYAADQLTRLNHIIALKDLGLTLEQLAPLLDEHVATEQLRGMLHLKRFELEQQVSAQQSQLARVEARLGQLEGRNMSNYEVVLKTVPEQTVVSVRETLPLPGDQGRLFFELESYLRAHDGAAVGAPFAMYHNEGYRVRDLDIEVAIPADVAKPGGDRPQVYRLPSVRAACAVHQGDFSAIGEAYQAVGAWIEANGYRIVGPCREVNLRFSKMGSGLSWPESYLTDDPNEYVTEVQFPVEKAQERVA